MPLTAPERRFRQARLGLALAAGLALAIASAAVRSDTDPQHRPPPPFLSRPDLRAPLPQVTGRASGYVFLAPKRRHQPSGPMIVDPTGEIVWFRPLARGVIPDDLKVQRYRGQPVLTWWEGRTNARGYGRGVWVIADSSYREIARVKAGNGLQGDLHDMVLTDRGTALITVYQRVRTDQRPASKDGEAVDSIVQEIDVATGKVVFEWHSLDHVKTGESQAGSPSKFSFPYDYFHINSIDVDHDGHLLISGRNTWAIYKVHRTTGRVIWRLGGKNSDFKMGPGAQFVWQHDARRQPDGTITVFDNQSAPKVGEESRLLTLRLDMQRMRADVVKSITYPRRTLLSDAEGNYQRLPNGNHFAGWGIVGLQSEFDRDGKLRFDLKLPGRYDSYRAFVFDWKARPAERPALKLERDGDSVTAYASWNGATDVTGWRLLAGEKPNAMKPIASARRTGFETTLKANSDARFFAVQAMAGDTALATSAARG